MLHETTVKYCQIHSYVGLVILYSSHGKIKVNEAWVSVDHSALGIGIMIIIYLLTAIGLSPGGSTHLHTNNT